MQRRQLQTSLLQGELPFLWESLQLYGGGGAGRAGPAPRYTKLYGNHIHIANTLPQLCIVYGID